MQHLANHSTYHRGQISLMMRQLAAAPVATDFACFYWRDAARQPMYASLLNEDLIQPGKARDGHLPPYRWPHTAFRLGLARDNSRMVGKPYLMALRQSCPLFRKSKPVRASCASFSLLAVDRPTSGWRQA